MRDQEVIEQITHLAGVAIERKLTQEVLRRSEAYLAEAQKLAHMSSWVWEVTGRNALYVSEEWYRVSGFDSSGGTPNWAEQLERVHHEDRVAFQAKIDRAIAEKSDYDVEFRIVLPRGPIRFIRSVGHPVLGPSGESLQFLAVEIDVTDSRQAEEERERLRQQLAHLAHLDRVSTIGELTASLAHEIMQPIGAAVTNAEACLRLISRDQPDVVEAREAALEMTRDGRRAADVIDRVRSLYQKGSPQKEFVDVSEVIREMVGMLSDEASKYSVTMRTDLAEGLPKVIVDRVQLQQALMNLMLNGIEAMRETAGELSIKSERAEDGQLMVSVTDTGIGLPAGDVDRIFSAFVTTKSQGTGLGLAITRSIIESHGGSIRAFANSGPGATFQFTLPGRVALSA
ncbi:MAG TPA: ATP-binding protein [Verrucomicrobiae bacterium]|nr:ATP-binding protein [Verrucomicrobiae bacterium]